MGCSCTTVTACFRLVADEAPDGTPDTVISSVFFFRLGCCLGRTRFTSCGCNRYATDKHTSTRSHASFHTHHVVPLDFQFLLEPLERVRLLAHRILVLTDARKRPSRLVHAQLANVHVILHTVHRTALAERGRIQHPAAAHDHLDGHLLVQRHAHHLVLVEFARRLVVRLMRTQIVVAVHEAPAGRILPQLLDAKDVALAEVNGADRFVRVLAHRRFGGRRFGGVTGICSRSDRCILRHVDGYVAQHVNGVGLAHLFGLI